MTNRRDLLKSGLGTIVLLGSGMQPLRAMQRAAHRAAGDNRPYLSAALQSAAWLQRARQETDHGVTWPVDPLKPDVIDQSLYSGAPGILPFWLELHRATGDAAFLKEAMLGADHIAATQLTAEQLRDNKEVGLGFYLGIAGLAYVMELVHQACGESRYREAAQRVVDVMQEKTHAGADWPDSNDVISGAAGSGLFLLWWSDQANDAKAGALARTAGDVLVSRSRPAPGGVAWSSGNLPNYYPNFSHGTAGIAYFLAALSKASGEREYQRAAIRGAEHLQTIAVCNDDGCLVHRHEPGAEQLYYLGWCHGPAGTSQLYHLLAQQTRNRSWRKAERRSADGVLHSGIPEKATAGFWNNVSQCCGSAGVAQFMLSLYRNYGERRYLDFAHRMTENLLSRATLDDQGMRWVQAEHRVKPDQLVAQTGYMQGAAGIGSWLLRLDGHSQRRASMTGPKDV